MYQVEFDITDDTLLKQTLGMFPGVMNQQDDSNNARILTIIAEIGNAHKNDALTLSDMMSVKQAHDDYLTNLAADWGISRIDDDDEFLRFRLRLVKLKGHLGTSLNDIKTMISQALNIDTTDFDVVGTGNPEEVRIINIPFDFTETERDKKVKLFEQLIQDCMPLEYNLTEVQYATHTKVQLYAGAVTQHYRKTYPQLIERS